MEGDSKPEFLNLLKQTNPDAIKKMCMYVNEKLKIKDVECTMHRFTTIYFAFECASCSLGLCPSFT